MAVPIGLIAPLLLGAGLGAKHMMNKAENDRVNERIQMLLGQTQGTPTAAPAEIPEITGAMQPTEAPQPAVPDLQGSMGVPEEERAPAMRPGEMTELPILPTSQLLDPTSAPMYPKGISVDESGGMNIQMARDTQQLDAMWMQHFQTNRQRYAELPPLEADQRAIADTIRRTGRMPTAQSLQMLDPTRREQVSEQTYWSAVLAMQNSPEIRRALQMAAREDGLQLDERALDAALQHYALRAVTNEMGGYMPEDAQQVLMPLSAPPLTDDVMAEVFNLFGESNPHNVTQQMAVQANESLRKKSLEQKRGEATATDLGQEDAAQAIHAQEFGGGAGPVGREVDKRQAMATTEPIDPKVRAEAGVPNDIVTYADLLDKNQRLLSPADRKLVGSVKQVSKIISQLKDLAFGFTDHEGNVRPGIFTSEDDLASRGKHGIFLAGERLSGTPLGVSVNEYQDATEGMIRVLLELAGESGGRFTDKDVEQIKKQVANLVGPAGLVPEGRLEASGKMARMERLLVDKLAFIHSPQMVTMGERKPTKRYNPKTGQKEDM